MNININATISIYKMHKPSERLDRWQVTATDVNTSVVTERQSRKVNYKKWLDEYNQYICFYHN